MNKIKILVVEPNKQPYPKMINNTEDEIYGLVYYPYKKLEIEKNVFLMYSKEATENQDTIFKVNRRINKTLIYGTFIIVGNKNNNFISLNDRQIEELTEFLSNCKDVNFK